MTIFCRYRFLESCVAAWRCSSTGAIYLRRILLQSWLEAVQVEYADRILTFDAECAHIWGQITANSYQNLIDKQIAAMALLYDLTIVSRNIDHFSGTGARVLNPFQDSEMPGGVAGL